MFKVGDQVSAIHEEIKGVVKAVSNDQIQIEDQDGFIRKYDLNELSLTPSERHFKIDDIDLTEEAQNKINHSLSDPVKLKKYEIDLHIEELIESHANMTNHEILMKQMDHCKRFVSKSIETNVGKIVLIHGKGQGVLKTEIYQFLNNLKFQNGYNLMFHDASFAEYGFGGATEILFNQD
jgi:dsDNA-specific endonuclease/ATPase MutS2